MIEVVGHGGAGDFFPGNSRRSVEKALELGVDRIEIDVQLAGDGTLVLVHDDHIQHFGRRTSIRRLRLSDLQESLDGLLTLDEVIALTAGRCSLMIDMKSPGYERPVAAAIVHHGIAATTVVSSTYGLSLRQVKRATPGVAIGLSTGHISTVMKRNKLISVAARALEVLAPAPVLAAAKAIDADHLMLNYRICSGAFVRMADRAGIGLYVWTVNHPRHIREMVDHGVTGIISNRPDLVREAVLRDSIPDR